MYYKVGDIIRTHLYGEESELGVVSKFEESRVYRMAFNDQKQVDYKCINDNFKRDIWEKVYSFKDELQEILNEKDD